MCLICTKGKIRLPIDLALRGLNILISWKSLTSRIIILYYMMIQHNVASMKKTSCYLIIRSINKIQAQHLHINPMMITSKLLFRPYTRYHAYFQSIKTSYHISSSSAPFHPLFPGRDSRTHQGHATAVRHTTLHRQPGPRHVSRP